MEIAAAGRVMHGLLLTSRQLERIERTPTSHLPTSSLKHSRKAFRKTTFPTRVAHSLKLHIKTEK